MNITMLIIRREHLKEPVKHVQDVKDPLWQNIKIEVPVVSADIQNSKN